MQCVPRLESHPTKSRGSGGVVGGAAVLAAPVGARGLVVLLLVRVLHHGRWSATSLNGSLKFTKGSKAHAVPHQLPSMAVVWDGSDSI